MKTLVIHPSDPTTDFLQEIYIDQDWDVMNESRITPQQVHQKLPDYDQIIMMGHGTHLGLLSRTGYVVTTQHAHTLRNKQYLTFIWCNADRFVGRCNLHGFYTGMIISEVEEAAFFDIRTDQSVINNSNQLFSKSLKNKVGLIHSPEILTEARSIYKKTNQPDPIIEFNETKLYYKQPFGD